MKTFCHRKLKRALWAGLLAGILAAWVSPAQAQPPPDPELARAKKLFLEAQAFYLKGQHDQAARKFLEAFGAKPFPAFLYNAAVAFEKAQMYPEAIKNFGRYLDLSPKSKDAAAIRTRMETLKKYLPPPPGQCSQNDDCAAGQICKEGRCAAAPPRPPAAECRKDDQCPAGQKCKRGKCRAAAAPPQACKADDQCPRGQVCREGQCRPAPRPPACKSDSGCAKGLVCLGGRCRKRPGPALPELKPKGLVIIDSKPRGAVVYLDDKMKGPLGKTPWQGSLDEGTYTVLVESKGNKPEKRRIDVRSDRLVDLYIALSREHYLGWVKVTSNVPGALVFFDQIGLGAVGRTPFTGFQKPGHHTVWVRKPGYETERKIVEVVSGESHDIHLILKRVQYGWLRLDGPDTRGAAVKVDGKKVCTAPCKATRIPSGGHVMTITRKGYKPVKRLIRMEQGKFTVVNATLIKKPTRISAYVTYGFVAVMLGTAVYALVEADAVKDSIERDIRDGKLVTSKDSRYRKGKVWSIVGNSLMGAAVITGAFALYYTFRQVGPKSSANIDVRGVKVSVVPQVGPGTVALSGQVRF